MENCNSTNYLPRSHKIRIFDKISNNTEIGKQIYESQFDKLWRVELDFGCCFSFEKIREWFIVLRKNAE